MEILHCAACLKQNLQSLHPSKKGLETIPITTVESKLCPKNNERTFYFEYLPARYIYILCIKSHV